MRLCVHIRERRQVGSRFNCLSSDVWLAIRQSWKEMYKQAKKQQFSNFCNVISKCKFLPQNIVCVPVMQRRNNDGYVAAVT